MYAIGYEQCNKLYGRTIRPQKKFPEKRRELWRLEWTWDAKNSLNP